MKKIFTIILFQLLLISSSNAEIIKKIDISGNNRVSDETVKIYGDIKINQNYSEKDLNKILTIFIQQTFLKMCKLT